MAVEPWLCKAKAVELHGEDSVFVTKPVETQGKGGVLATEGSGNVR